MKYLILLLLSFSVQAGVIGRRARDVPTHGMLGSACYLDGNYLVKLDSSGNVGIGITPPTGTLHLDKGTATASTLKYTANTTTGQTSSDGFDVGITTTGLAELRQRENLDMVFYTNNTERFRIAANSAMTFTGAISTSGGFDITSSSSVVASGSSKIQWVSRSAMTSPSDGNIRITNQANTDFGLLQFGGTTSSFPALKRSTTTLEARLADDSGFAAVQTLYHRFGSGTPEGVVTAPIGAIFSRTDGGAGTSLYVKQSGVGNTGWAAK